jgi:GDSL-like lipase/acylhydrolase family protein
VTVLRAALGLIALAAAAEVALRLARYGPTIDALGPWSPAPPWEALRALGPDGAPEPRPGGEGTWAIGPGEPRVQYRLDRLGLRAERDPSLVPARGTCRILALGDAYTFGYGVSDAQTWPRELERRLAHVEVLNAGFPNLNVEQERRRLALLLPRVRPHVVVATFDWWNVPAPPPPRLRRWSAAWWVANLDDRVSRVAARVAVVHEVAGVVRRAASPWLVRPSGLARELEPLTRPPAELAARWQRTRAALAGMAADATAAGARFLLVATPLDVQVDPARNALYREGRLPYPAHGFVDVDYRAARDMPDALRQFAADAGIPFLDLTSVFARRGGVRLFLARDYHLGAPGHRLIAREIARWLRGSRACVPARQIVGEHDGSRGLSAPRRDEARPGTRFLRRCATPRTGSAMARGLRRPADGPAS